MNSTDAIAEERIVLPRTIGGVRQRMLLHVENFLLCAALAAMVLVPLTERVLRRSLGIGIPDAASITQHLVLIVSMVGGAIAAREGRVLALANMGSALKGRWKAVSDVFTSALVASVTVLLCAASWQLVQVERGGGKILAYGIPVWAIEMFLPAGYAAIALRTLFQATAKWRSQILVAVLAGGMVFAALRVPVTGLWTWLGLILIGGATLLGIPAFVTLGGVALVLFWSADLPIAAISIAHYSLVTNPVLPTLPLFTLAGSFLAEGGAPKRLVRVFYAVFGTFRGGPALVTVVVCAFFTSFTGASGVTILALGGLLMPILVSTRYSEKDALGLVTGAGSLGLLLPPCLPLIVYAIVARVPIQKMFLAAIVPAVVMMIATSLWGIWRGSKVDAEKQPFDAIEACRALWDAKWELLIPVVASVALFGGFATPVEASALTAFYAFMAEAVFHHDLKIFRDVPRAMVECGLLIGGVLLILGVALGFTNYLVDAEVPVRAVAWTTDTIHSPFLFLLLLNLFLLIVGSLVEIYPAIVIDVPLLVPLGAAYGIDPVRLGIIFLANMELGYLTPPVGLNLLMSSYRFKKPVLEVLRAVLPVVVVLSIGVLLITYFPALTNALPRWFGY